MCREDGISSKDDGISSYMRIPHIGDQLQDLREVTSIVKYEISDQLNFWHRRHEKHSEWMCIHLWGGHLHGLMP